MKELLTQRDDIFIVKNFISDDLCDELLNKANQIGFDEATVNASGGTIINKSMRDNDRVIIDDPLTACQLWVLLEPYVIELTTASSKPIGLNERFRYYRYTPGQHFDWHFDSNYHRNAYELSQLTFMIYLNGGYTGGTTDFNFKLGTIRDDDPVISAKPEKGMALVFTQNVLHRGAPVLSGEKYVLRSDVMYKMEHA